MEQFGPWLQSIQRMLEQPLPFIGLGVTGAVVAGLLVRWMWQFAGRPLAALVIVRVRRRIHWRQRRTSFDHLTDAYQNAEHEYLLKFIEFVEQRRWEPRRYVARDFKVNERIIEPIDPVLLVVETINADHLVDEMSLQDRRDQLRTRRSRDLISEVTRLSNVVLLGEPGAGKTTALLQLGFNVANQARHFRTAAPLLPLFVPLNEYTERDSAGKPEPVLDFVRRQLAQQTQHSPSADILQRLEGLLREGRLLLLFDAMDEMPRDDYDERFRALSAFASSYSSNNFVFSCRLLDYVDDPTFQFQQIILSPLTENQIQDFFVKYLGENGKQAYVDIFGSGGDLTAQIRSPFYLSVVTACEKRDATLVSSWDALLRNYIEIVLDRERERRGILLESQQWETIDRATQAWLTNLAFELVTTRSTGTKADPELVRSTLEAIGHGEEPRVIAQRCGLIRSLNPSGSVRFEHHRLQEYFAAIHLAELLDNHSILEPHIIEDIWWREVIAMASGIMSRPERLLNQLLDYDQRGVVRSYTEIRRDFKRFMLAMRCYLPSRAKLDVRMKRRLAERLIQFMRRGNTPQRVQALRVASEFDNDNVLREVELLLNDRSPWVRERALTSVLESARRSGQQQHLLSRMMQTAGGEDVLLNGLRKLPLLLRYPVAYFAVPMFIALLIFHSVRLSFVWLLFTGIFTVAWINNRASNGDVLVWILAIPFGYLLIRWLERRKVYFTFLFGASKGFNRWCLVSIGYWLVFTIGSSLVSISTGNTDGLAQGTIRFFYNFIVALVLVLAFKNWIRLGAGFVQKLREERNVATVRPKGETIEIRTGRARNLLYEARECHNPVKRQILMRSIAQLVPLDESILVEIEKFAREETDVDVADTVWQLYEEIDAAVERRRFGQR